MYQHEHDPTLADFYGSDSDRKFSTKLGTFYNDRCDRSGASPVTAQIYFYSFTMLTAFVVFSLFVSVIEMGMFETMEELEAEAREAAAELEDAPEFGQDHPNQWLVGCDDSTDHVQRHRAKHRTADFASITKGAGLQVDALGSDALADAGGDALDTRDAIELYLDGPRSFDRCCGAFKQVVYVGVVMALINFNLAVVGMHLFRGNDPGRFGTLGRRWCPSGACRRSAWDAALYTNMYGCSARGYPHGGRACNDATAYGWIAVGYFVFIVIIGGLVLPTVLIGIISIAFEESTEEMRLESLANGVIDSMKARVLDWDAGPRILSEMKHLEAGYRRLAAEQSRALGFGGDDEETVAASGLDEEVILALCRFVLDHHTHWLDEKTLAMMACDHLTQRAAV
ncbi:low voltage-gated calcium channel [Aureococcus anophagefferens]|uniref:Low voltage-gated calcium channel n=1 Tax=Aureococcus anophagefferens TaxID=44056 RepID=A0ABR1FMJ6_AURAN